MIASPPPFPDPLRRQVPGRERGLQVVAPGIPVDVQHFAGKNSPGTMVDSMVFWLTPSSATPPRVAIATEYSPSAATVSGNSVQFVTSFDRCAAEKWAQVRSSGMPDKASSFLLRRSGIGYAARMVRNLPAGVLLHALSKVSGKLLASHGAHKRQPDTIPCPDIPRSIQDARAGKAKVREEEIPGIIRDFFPVPPDRERQGLKRDTGKCGKREAADPERSECRCGLRQRLAECCSKAVPVTGRAGQRIGPTAGGNDDCAGRYTVLPVWYDKPLPVLHYLLNLFPTHQFHPPLPAFADEDREDVRRGAGLRGTLSRPHRPPSQGRAQKRNGRGRRW